AKGFHLRPIPTSWSCSPCVYILPTKSTAVVSEGSILKSDPMAYRKLFRSKPPIFCSYPRFRCGAYQPICLDAMNVPAIPVLPVPNKLSRSPLGTLICPAIAKSGRQGSSRNRLYLVCNNKSPTPVASPPLTECGDVGAPANE